MSRLDDELKKLRVQKQKAEFFRLIKDNLSKINSDKFKDVAQEVKDEVNGFLDAQIDIIESGEIRQESELETLFTSDEVMTLKKLAARAMGKKVVTTDKPPKQEPKKPREEQPTQDKITFALAHRSLGGKRVQIKDKGNGVCVGLDAPYVVVKLDNGTTVEVRPEELIV